jgi:hypothetical protein
MAKKVETNSKVNVPGRGPGTVVEVNGNKAHVALDNEPQAVIQVPVKNLK